jgi:hypothetical protein
VQTNVPGRAIVRISDFSIIPKKDATIANVKMILVKLRSVITIGLIIACKIDFSIFLNIRYNLT